MNFEEYIPFSKQVEFHNALEKFKLYGGAMGGGKSYTLVAEAIRLSLTYPGNRGYLCRKTYKDFKRTTLPILNEMLPTRVIESYNKVDGEIYLINGSIIYMGDLEQTDKLKSMNLGWYGIDEASEADEDRFNMLNTRLRLALPGIRRYGLLASNPEPGWLKDRFVDPQLLGQRKEDHIFIQALPTDNPHLPLDYIESLRRDLPPLWRLKYLDGSWEVFDAQIFRPEWLKPSKPMPSKEDIAFRITAVDPAIGEKEENDETAIVTMGIDYNGIIHELETVHGRWSFNTIVDNCMAVNARHNPEIFAVEYVAFQKALGDMLGSKGISVHALKADHDKVRRAISVTHLFEQDKVRVNTHALIKQMIEFPKGSHDDLCDSLVYTLRLFKQFSEEEFSKKSDKLRHLKEAKDGASLLFWEEHHNETEGINISFTEDLGF